MALLESYSSSREIEKTYLRVTRELSLTLLPLAACVGVAAHYITAVSRLTEVRLRHGNDLVHLETIPSIFYGTCGAVAGICIGFLILRWIKSNPNSGRGPRFWILIFILTSIGIPLLTGFFMPFGKLFIDIYDGHSQNIFQGSLSAFISAPKNMFVYATMGIYPGLIAGALFSAIGSLIDLLLRSDISRLIIHPISLATSLLIVVLSRYLPLEFLSSLG